MNVFLVEDALLIRERIKGTVEEAGGHVIGEAATEQEAVAGLLATHPDIAVVDLRLAEGSGIDVIRQVKRASPETVMVVLTNHADMQYWNASMEAGAEFFFDKTADFPRFVEVMETLIQTLQISK
jgi:DNA-binding NarL/FixJ family response regulator